MLLQRQAPGRHKQQESWPQNPGWPGGATSSELVLLAQGLRCSYGQMDSRPRPSKRHKTAWQLLLGGGLGGRRELQGEGARLQTEEEREK